MKRLLTLALLVFGCADAQGEADARKRSDKVAPKARAARVEVATIKTAKPTLELVLPGEVIGSKDAKLASPSGGYVERVFVDVGDRVKAGQALASVNRASLEVQLASTKVQLDQAESNLKLVLRAGKSLPQSRRDAAHFQKAAAEASHRLAQINANRAVVRTPFAGVIAENMVEQGEVLASGGGVMRVVRLDPIHVSISVSDYDVVSLKKGMPAQVTTGARPEIFQGRIERVSPAADLNTRTFEVLVEIDNKEGSLRPGMIATIRMQVSIEGEQNIAVPQHVLVTKLGGNGVYVEEQGVARWRPLELGIIVRGQIVVESGIAVGDRIVVTGHRELADGDALLVARQGICCTAGQIVFEGR